MVLFRIEASGGAPALQSHLAALGIRIIAMDREWLRIVTHRDVTSAHMEALRDGLRSFQS
jgi:hypothetical protein